MSVKREDLNRMNFRETGAQKLQASRDDDGLPPFPDTGDRGDLPPEPYGLTERVDDSASATRHHDGVDQPRTPRDMATQEMTNPEAVNRSQSDSAAE